MCKKKRKLEKYMQVTETYHCFDNYGGYNKNVYKKEVTELIVKLLHSTTVREKPTIKH